MLKIMVTGSREWNNVADMRHHLAEFIRSRGVGRAEVMFVLGDARGADSIAEACALSWGIPAHIHVAHWDELGRKAGALRNQAMVKDLLTGPEEDERVCLAFLQEGAGNVGTKMAMEMAKKADIKVVQFVSSPIT